MKYNTPKQRLKVYEKLLLNWVYYTEKNFGFCQMLWNNIDIGFFQTLKYFPEINRGKYKKIPSGLFWFDTDINGYIKRKKILLKAIEDAKQAIKIQDQQKNKRKK